MPAVPCAVPLLWIEYLLLRSASKAFLLLVLPTLKRAQYQQVFGSQQVPMLANLALKCHEISFNLALLFFGGTCLLNKLGNCSVG